MYVERLQCDLFERLQTKSTRASWNLIYSLIIKVPSRTDIPDQKRLHIGMAVNFNGEVNISFCFHFCMKYLLPLHDKLESCRRFVDQMFGYLV